MWIVLAVRTVPLQAKPLSRTELVAKVGMSGIGVVLFSECPGISEDLTCLRTGFQVPKLMAYHFAHMHVCNCMYNVLIYIYIYMLVAHHTAAHTLLRSFLHTWP